MGRKRGLAINTSIVFMIGILLLALTGPALSAEKYPEKTITLVVTHAAGGSTDLPARLVQPFLEKELGVSVVIVNKVGAGGNIARSYVWKVPPDGYNLMVTQEPSMCTGAIVSGGDFDPLGFVPIYNLGGKQFMAVAVPNDSPIKTLSELVAASKKKDMTQSGGGVGTTSWLNHVLLIKKTGGQFRYVPYNSSPESVMALAGGQVESLVTNYTFLMPLHEQKKLRMIAILGPERVEGLPDIPTAKEQGIDVATDQICAVYGPPKLPQEKVKILADAFEKATKDPDFHKKARDANCPMDLMGPAKLKATIQEIYEMVQSVRPEIEAVKGQMK